MTLAKWAIRGAIAGGVIVAIIAFGSVSSYIEAAEREEFAKKEGIDVNSLDLTRIQTEMRIHELVNEERVRYGLAPLAWSDTLAETAREHSEYMIFANDFNHSKSFCRAENIAMSESRGIGAEWVVHGWMNSEGHRANILNPAYTEEGIGIHGGYVTQNFC